jgi:DNA invertase Pin-like site-specific DNA recombinase
VLGYTRVSTQEQAAEGQEDALRAAGADRVWSDVASGAKAAAQRPGLAGLLEHARAGDVVLVTRLDRLGRSLPDLVGLLAELEARQVTVRSLGDGVDTSTAAGRLVAGLWAVLAEAERAWIRERTLTGLAAARARGRVGGRPPGLSGDRLDAARDLHAAGRSLGQIARALRVGTSTVRRHLQAAGIDTSRGAA